jgi:hypothetical protein
MGKNVSLPGAPDLNCGMSVCGLPLYNTNVHFDSSLSLMQHTASLLPVKANSHHAVPLPCCAVPLRF